MDRIATLREYLNASPNDNFLQHALALELIKEGDDAGARSLFQSILQRDPSYTGTYYHLAKLLERTGETELAVQWYEAGMKACKEAGDQHAYNELQAAYEDLIY
jgi:Tfp pilus assembly protein PilF